MPKIDFPIDTWQLNSEVSNTEQGAVCSAQSLIISGKTNLPGAVKHLPFTAEIQALQNDDIISCGQVESIIKPHHKQNPNFDKKTLYAQVNLKTDQATLSHIYQSLLKLSHNSNVRLSLYASANLSSSWPMESDVKLANWMFCVKDNNGK